ncbi:MAG: CDP-alcohol phosphatidyltransferase family protein [Phycisphaerae bacterium]|nr:CDP-alcohol phosphatidyltransferase family protein [Phycisphaerae bacterium]
MKWNLPNQLTLGRVGLSAVFFVLLGLYRGSLSYGPALLSAAFVVFIIACITDVLDGYFARKLNQTSAFGRMVDPIVDKILVVGAFAMLAGPDYALVAVPAAAAMERGLPAWLTGGMSSAVQTWMVVVILAREFIISGIRGYSEAQGIKFPAIPAGKFKMLTQSAAIGTVLYQLAWLPDAAWAIWVKIIIVWLAVIITVLSGAFYIHKARILMNIDEKP